MSEAGTSGGSSPLNISHSSSADSPAGSDDLDAQPDKNEQSQGDPKKKDARDARTDRKKQSKQSRKRNRAAVEEGEEEERRELRERMFGSRDKSSNVPIEAVVSATVCGKCIYSSFSSNKAATTSWTASITVDLPTLNTGPMLTYELPCASLYIPRAKTFSGGIQSLNRVFSLVNHGVRMPTRA